MLWVLLAACGCFYIKTSVCAAKPATETDRYLTECYHGAYDFAGTIIIIKLPFQGL